MNMATGAIGKIKSPLINLGKLPFQDKYDVGVPGLEAAKAALPIFGGTNPETPSGETKPDETTPKTEASETKPGGDSETKPETLSTEQIAELMAKVKTVETANSELTNKLKSFTDKEEAERKAGLGREEALSEELDKANATIAAMDEIIKYVSLVNAISTDPDTQFHDIDFVMSKLDESGYDFEMDLESKKAKVKGINAELKRIAKENEWAVKNVASTEVTPTRTPAKPSGKPPANPGPTPKAAGRAAMIDRFPVLAAGRSGIKR